MRSHWQPTVSRLFWLVLALAGCATNPPPLATTLPQSALLEQVPFIAQDAHSCGPASLAMVLQYFGRHDAQKRLKPMLLLPEREGTLQIELTAAARREGFLALAGPTSMEVALEDIAAGFPVIVLQNLRFQSWPLWHYAVMVGFDQAQSLVLLRSGDNALIEVPFHTFINTWKRAEFWALVVTPATRLPPSATPAALVRAAEALAHNRHPAQALGAYVVGTRRWPAETALWNGMGNLAYTQQRWSQARHAFAKSLQLAPGQARIWNNFAYTLQQSGCTRHANQALLCAETLAPQDPLIRGSRADIRQMQSASEAACDVIISACRIEQGSIAPLEFHLQ